MIKRLKKFWWWIILALSAVLVASQLYVQHHHASLLTSEEQQWLNEHPVIRITPNPNFPPLEFFERDSTYTGLASEIIRLVEQRIGRRFTIVRYPAQGQIFAAIRNHETDLLPAVNVTPLRKEYLNFTDPLIELQNVLVARKNDERSYALDSLQDKKLVLVKGSSPFESLLQKYPGIHIDTVATGIESMYEVSFGHADATIVNLASASYLIQKRGLANLRVAGDYSEKIPVSMAVRQDWSILVAILNKTLASIPREEYDRIVYRWLGLQVEEHWTQRIPSQWILSGFACLGILSIIVILWSHALRRQVKLKTEQLQLQLNEQMKTEEALRASEEKLRQITDNMVDLIARFDERQNFVYVSPSYKKILGYSPEELLGIWGPSLLAPEDREASIEAISAMLRRGAGSVQFRYLSKDGHYRWFESTGQILLNPDGSLNGSIMGSRDITERKRVEEAYRASEKMYKSVIENMKDVFYRSDLSNRVIMVSPSVLDLFGGDSIDEMIGIPMESFWFDPLGRAKALEAMRRDGYIYDYEAVFKRRDGSAVSVSITAHFYYDEKGNILGTEGTIRDITERKQLTKQLAESQKMESLGTLAGGVAHDFNNILNIIIGYADRLLKKLERTEHKHSIETILHAADRAADLVKQILTFARQTQQESMPLDLNALIEELAKLLYETFPRSIEITTDLHCHLSPILGDRTHIHQALLNLAVNARDAMPHGGKLIFKTELITSEQVHENFSDAAETNFVRITVEDTGQGMEESVVRRIFEPFFTTKEQGRGTGLGLSVVYGIVTSMKGFIDVQSTLGKGTTFTLYLPAVSTPLAHENADTFVENVQGGNETILIVEDEEVLREILAEVLEVNGYTVHAAQDGTEALKIFQDHQGDIHLVISDLGLPKMNGFECFTAMKEKDAGVRMILASGFIDPRERSKMEEAGIRTFLQKPYHPETVLKTIRQVLDKKD